MTHYQPPTADEKALLLREYDTLRGKRLFRYQTIVVVRDDKPREFIQTLGPSESFPGANDVMIYSGYQDSCAELMEAAEKLRFDRGLMQAMADQTGQSTLVKDYQTREEQRRAFYKQNPRTAQQLLRSN